MLSRCFSFYKRKGMKTMFLKQRRIKLHGTALRKLNNAIFERDSHACVCCGAYVSSDHKFHHEPCGAYKSDEISKGVVLCTNCHFLRHNSGKYMAGVRDAAIKHLQNEKIQQFNTCWVKENNETN